MAEIEVNYNPAQGQYIARLQVGPGVEVMAGGGTPEAAREALRSELWRFARLQHGMDRGV